MWFSAPHWAFIVSNFLERDFPGHWIGRDGLIQWPSHLWTYSLRFFLMGFVKKVVYKTKVNNIAELISMITATIAMVIDGRLASTRREPEYHLDVVCATNGAYT